jgi:hypothetical protein
MQSDRDWRIRDRFSAQGDEAHKDKQHHPFQMRALNIVLAEIVHGQVWQCLVGAA